MTARKRRPHFTRFIHFIDKDVPTEPHPQALSAVKKKPNIADVIANVKEVSNVISSCLNLVKVEAYWHSNVGNS
jgi:hypothetical protein